MNDRPSQANLILLCLKQQMPNEVPMPTLSRISHSFAVHSRIAELRRRGHLIPPARVEQSGHAKHSFYKLLPLAKALGDGKGYLEKIEEVCRKIGREYLEDKKRKLGNVALRLADKVRNLSIEG